jgi:hypothetical protein
MEPRPLGRVLHACLVSARLITVLERLQQVVPASDLPTVQRRRATALHDFAGVMSTLEATARWTPRGQRLFESMQELLARGLGDVTPS